MESRSQQTIRERTTSSSQKSLTGDLAASSFQNSVIGSQVASSSQNSMTSSSSSSSSSKVSITERKRSILTLKIKERQISEVCVWTV